MADARYTAGKNPVGHIGNAQDGVDPGRNPERQILGHEYLCADHVALHNAEHEGSARGIGLDEAADVDVAPGNDAVERRDHALIVLLLAQYLPLRLLRRDVGLGDAKGGFLRLERLHVADTLLLRCPTLADERIVALPGHSCQIQGDLRLLLRRLQLRQRGFCLSYLVIKLGSGDLNQRLPFLYRIADIHVALVDIAARASEDVRGGERRGRRRKPRDRDGVGRLPRRAP